MRLSKIRTTNYGPAREPGKTGLDFLSAAQAAEARNADAWVSGYSDTVLRGIFGDLSRELSFDRKDPVQRWKMARKAAVGRRLTHTRTSA